MEKFLTRNVFIDTSIFCKEGFNFAGHKLAKMCELASYGQINLLLTDISLRETNNHFSGFIEEIERSHSTLKRKVASLACLPEFIGGSTVNTDDKEIAQCLQEAKNFFESFVNAIGADVISVSQVDSVKVFDLYFSSQPPFGTGKKKNEFPDAFSLLSLEEWCNQQNEKVYVVSSDKDMELYCANSNNLFYLSDLSHFLDLVNLEDNQISEIVKKWFAENQDVISSKILFAYNQEIEKQGISVKSVQSFSIELTGLELGKDVYTTSIGQNYVYASAQVKTTVSAKGRCKYSDLPSQFELPTKQLGLGNNYASFNATWSFDREVEIELIRGSNLLDLKLLSVSLIKLISLDLDEASRLMIVD